MKNYTFLLCFLIVSSIMMSQNKPQIIVETDMGGDSDDQASFVRFLMYANEFDIKGIITSRKRLSTTGLSENPSASSDPFDMARDYINAYDKFDTNLRRHDTDYPAASTLRNITKSAHRSSSSNTYNQNDAVNLIIKVLREVMGNNTHIWYTNWGCNDGSVSSLKKALDIIEANKALDFKYEDVVRRIHYVEYHDLVSLSPLRNYNLPQELRTYKSLIGRHINKVNFSMDTFLPESNPGFLHTRWAVRWESLTGDETAINATNLRPLTDSNTSKSYYTGPKEGDTMTWMHLIENGINVVGAPYNGGWAGRYQEHTYNYNGVTVKRYQCRQSDFHRGSTSRDNTLKRWGTSTSKSTDIINDFRSRLQWAKQSAYANANHAPIPKVKMTYESGDVLNSLGTRPLFEFTATGTTITIDASGSTDPDNNNLKYEWTLYRELTDPAFKNITIRNATSAKATISIPNVEVEGLIHMYVRVTDIVGSGKVPITRYQRVVLKTLGKPYASKSMKLVNQANQTLPTNLIINRQNNNSHQVKVIATSNRVPISKIELYSNNVKIGEDSTAPYTFNFNKSKPGAYRIRARLWYSNNTYSIYSNQSTITIRDVFIGNTKAKSSKSYSAKENFGKIKLYTDRSTTVTSFPSFLNKAEYIATPNDDKRSTTRNLLTISLNKTADVYVAYDRRLTRIPVWLRSFTDTREHIRTSNGTIMRLYKKKFNAGNVILGGNESKQNNSSNYFVIVQKPLVRPPGTLISSIHKKSSRSYKTMTGFGKVLYYTDRSDKVTILPSYLNGAEYVMTPNSDKSLTTANLLTLNLASAADVYVAYDRRLTRIPVWLRSYTDTREHIRTSHGVIYRLYKKRVTAGNASLGGNESRQSNSSNYFVIVKEVGTGKSLPVSNTKNSELPKLKVYPVPTKGTLFINSNQEKHWTLFDIQGKIIKKGLSNRIDLSNLINGMYFINIDQKNYKVLKQ